MLDARMLQFYMILCEKSIESIEKEPLYQTATLSFNEWMDQPKSFAGKRDQLSSLEALLKREM